MTTYLWPRRRGAVFFERANQESRRRLVVRVCFSKEHCNLAQTISMFASQALGREPKKTEPLGLC